MEILQMTQLKLIISIFSLRQHCVFFTPYKSSSILPVESRKQLWVPFVPMQWLFCNVLALALTDSSQKKKENHAAIIAYFLKQNTILDQTICSLILSLAQGMKNRQEFASALPSY